MRFLYGIIALVALPALASHARADSAQIERGEYLVNLLSCGSCHTDGC